MTKPSAESDRGSNNIASVDVERRQITVVFSDLVGFTPITEKLGDEDTYELIRRLTTEQEAVIQRYGGNIQDFAGDGIMAVFGAPTALEDAPLRACKAALEIQDRMQEIGSEIRSKYNVEPELRIGINSGTAIVGKMGESEASASSALGDTVNVASRLESAAGPGTVVISATTHQLVSPFVETASLGEQQLKGKSKPEPVFRLDGIRKELPRFEAARQRGLTDLVGRSVELDLLLKQSRAVRTGHPTTVNIVGEAGIGKSRLIYELCQSLSDDGAVMLQGSCRSDSTAAPFTPFIDMLRGLLGVSEKMTSEQIEARIRDGLAALSIDVDATLPYVLNLLGQRIDKRDGLISSSTGPAESAGVRTRRALRDIIDRQCPRTRVALIIEDLHWIDTASEEILQAICTSTKSGHLFIVTSYRPTYTPRWVGAPDVTDLQLARLTTDEVVGLMSARLATNKLQEGLVQLVVGKSDGNPLFAEELISYLLHRQMIVSTPDGIRLADTVDSAGLPASLENLLMERVDQLDENPRAVIRTASVVGRRFASSVVQEAGALNGSFSHDLAVLETMELVFPEAESTYSDYIFKHALVQDAVYRTLMRSDREKLHRRVGEVIEKRYADTVDEISDVLVHHFEQGRLGNKAVRYMALAGHRALALLSLDEAELRLRQVIEIVEQDPDAVDDEIFAEVLIDMLHLTCWRYNFAEMLTLSQRHLPRIERFGESRQLSRVLQWAGEALICAARFDEAAEVLGRSLAIGEKLDNKECTMFALWDLMWLFSVRPDGQPNDYIEKTGQRVLALAHELDDYYHEALARYLLSADCLQRGHLAEAEKWAQESIEFGHETGYAPAISLGLMFAALCDAMRGCLERALERADEAVARCAGETERAIALGAKGVVLALSGQFDEAVQNLAYVRQVAHDQTFQVLLTYVEIPHGIARVFAGDQGGGIADLTRAIDLFSQWKNARMVAWAHLSLGQIYLHSATSEESPPSEGLQLAKRHLEEAVQIGQSAGTDGNVAEAMFNLGLLAKSMNQIGSAQVHLDEALRVAEPLSWPELVGKIETARAEL